MGGKNLTTGQPVLVILAFSLPLVIGNIFQQFYNMADAYVVGQVIGVEALAAVVSTGSLQFLILGFLLGCTAGAAIITAQRYGAGDEDAVKRSFACSIVICSGVTAALMAISILTLRPLLTLLNTPPEIFEGSYTYFLIMLAGMPAITLFNILSNAMRAVGDSRTPLYVLIAACLINIIFDYVFILFFGMNVEGAGFATIAAETISGLACIPVIKKRLGVLCIKKEHWKLSRAEYLEHLKMALPVGFQWSIIAIGAVAVSFAVNGMGYEAVAAFNIGQRIDQFASMPLSSYGQAITTFTAQNYGAKKYERIRAGMIQGSLAAIAFSVVMGAVFILFGDSLAAIFLRGNAKVIELAHTYLKVIGCFFVFLALLFTFRQCIQGMGNALVPTISGVTELIMRCFAALFLSVYFGYAGVCFAGPLAFLGALVPLSVAFFRTLKKLKLRELSGRRGV